MMSIRRWFRMFLARELDPRYFILLFLVSFVLVGQLYLNFFQKWDALTASVAGTMLTELLLVRWKHGKWAFPLSALITGLGISLLLSSHAVWPYALAAVLSIVIKHFVRFQGRHLFNPNNAALVLLLLFLPDYAVSTPKQWSNGFEMMAMILCLGCLAAYQARRLDSVFSFVVGFILFAFVRHYGFGEPLWFALGPLFGASFQLFTFFMITDPKTTPASPGARMLFGVLIALVDATLRVLEVTNSPFYASFLVTLMAGLPYRWLGSKRSTG